MSILEVCDVSFIMRSCSCNLVGVLQEVSYKNHQVKRL